MILWLKGVVFSVTIADLKRRPADLQNLPLRTHPPFITFNNEVKTNVNKIEEFLEDIVCPPKYLELSPKHAESNTAGMDVFAKFSAYIKNSRPEANEALEESWPEDTYPLKTKREAIRVPPSSYIRLRHFLFTGDYKTPAPSSFGADAILGLSP
uniref:CLIC N-terminal domain-containing protein n=1 Tax=Pan troglodytes TaxID=9598 RepID=A0A2I3T137_PANTR